MKNKQKRQPVFTVSPSISIKNLSTFQRRMIPIAALVGIMFVVVIATFEWTSISMLNKIPKSDALVIIAVTVVTVFTIFDYTFFQLPQQQPMALVLVRSFLRTSNLVYFIPLSYVYNGHAA